MKLSNHIISQLVKYVIGDNHEPYRTGSQILELFNEYGGYDFLPTNGLPQMPNSSLMYSRRTFAEQMMAEMNGKETLRDILEAVLNNSESPNAIKEMGELLSRDGYSIKKDNGKHVIYGGVIDKSKPIINETHFSMIEKQVLDALENAKVSIRVAMAWFTNDKIRDKLIEKQNEGVDVELIIYEDGVNKKHGVDLSQLSHILVKGSHGGIMHNKFCIIDNQVVVEGSYNWTQNAESRNDETVNVLRDPDTATKYSIEYKKIKSNNNK